jgi:hypothetical protein
VAAGEFDGVSRGVWVLGNGERMAEVSGMFVSTFEVPSTTFEVPSTTFEVSTFEVSSTAFKVSTLKVLTFHHVTNLLMLQDIGKVVKMKRSRRKLT